MTDLLIFYLVLFHRYSKEDAPEGFFLDTILNRHARKLLGSNRLKDLGRFSACLEFNLREWLRKERYAYSRCIKWIKDLRSRKIFPDFGRQSVEGFPQPRIFNLWIVISSKFIDYFMVDKRVRFLFTSCDESQTKERVSLWFMTSG